MKKIIYTLFLLFLLVNSVQAFSIDMDKINIKGKSDELISNLDKVYKIETKEFTNEIVNYKWINEYGKKRRFWS